MQEQSTTRDREIEAALAELEQWNDPTAWHRNHKRNLCREWNGWTVTIFRRYGGYRWCIAGDDDEREISPTTFETGLDAMIDLAQTLGIGT